MRLLITNIGLLVADNRHQPCLRGQEMARLDMLADAWLLVEDGRIKDFGSTTDEMPITEECIDAHGGAVLPSFCDSHTHLVYADSREGEFVDKIRGLSYAEIARRGGGILNSADRLHQLSEDELYGQAMLRIDEIIHKGTGAVEIKSGYGLNTEDELKMLRVIRRIRETAPLKVMATFLGAHAVGRGYTQEDYVRLVVDEMIPEVGRQQLADFIDVFCDEGFFTPDETARILEAGAKWGLRPKIHGQELADSGGVEVAVRHQALSVDHLESMTERDIELLAPSGAVGGALGGCIPTALPGTSFFLNMPFAPGRKMIDAGLPLAIASDYNPGSTPSGDMKFVVSLACIKMRLLPAEALNAATVNSAAAMGLSSDYGSLARGKVANFYITRPIPSINFLPYAYTTPLIERVFLRGEEYVPARQPAVPSAQQ
ncbi:MAG: imidazolonepropionase [Prevotella sp.]|nr:imidazolonepropionase [Prevotella sp.]